MFKLRSLLVSAAMIVPLMYAEVAQAQSQGWAGIDPVTKDYSNPVPYDTPAQACASHENSFVPFFGFQVFGVISVSPMGDFKGAENGVPVPATACRMNAGPNGTPTIVSLKGCTGGYRLVNGTCLPADYAITAEPACKGSKGVPGQHPVVGDPVSLTSGAKCEEVTDYSSGGPFPIEIKRYYRSMGMPRDANSVGTGLAWRTDLIGRRIRIDSSHFNVVISREDGAQTRFLNADNVADGVDWRDFSIETFVKNGTTFVQGETGGRDRFRTSGSFNIYQDEDDRTDFFLGKRLDKTIWKGGYQRNYVYESGDTNGLRPIQINDSLGRVVNIIWNGNLISEISLPDGTKLQYAYAPHAIDGDVPSAMVLREVTRRQADGTLIDTKGYQYGPSPAGSQVPLLTGVTDAKGVLIDATTYDAIGRVLTAQGPGGANGVTIAYNDQDNSRTVTNALGQVEVYSFAKVAFSFPGDPNTARLGMRSVTRQQSATVPAGTMTLGTDFDGFVKTDWNGIVTNLSYDEFQNETRRIEDSSGIARTTTTTWSPAFHVPTQIVQPNLTVDFTYDTAGRMTQRKESDTTGRNPVIRTWNYSWNSLGLLETVTGPRTDVAQTTTYTYDTAGNLATVKDALNHITTVNSVNAAGLPTSITDQNNVVTLMTYDPLGRIKTVSVQGPAPATTSFNYDENGLLTSVISPTNVTLAYGYDDAHRLTSITDGAGNKTVFALDGLGNRIQTQIQTGGAQVLMANSATFDSIGRLLTSIGAASQATRFEYDANGNLKKLTDPRNAVTQTAFDALNRVKQTTDALNAVTNLTYDGLDHVTSVTDARLHATSYTVNGFGFVTQMVSPDSGTTIYTYDLAGNVLSRKDARKVITNYSYDALDRPLTRTYPSATTENVTYGYDATANGNFGVGRLTSLTDSAGTASFTYDAYGNRIQEKRTIAGVVYTTGYEYDLSGDLTRITYPSGRIVNYQRDSLGQVSGVTTQANAGSGAVTLASNITYLPFGAMQAMTLGNGVQVSNSYDLDYRLTRTQATGATAVQDLTLGYDAASNISSIADGVTANLSQTFQYDLAGRVTQGVGPYGTDNYSFDALGNRLTRGLVNGGTTATTYTYTSSNTQLVKAVTGSATLNYAYDANGALLTRKLGNQTQANYTYNADARLLTAGGATLKYDAFGERSVETVTGGGTHFIFDQGGALIAEHGVTGALIRNTIYLNGQPLALVDVAGTISYILNDQLGQPQKMLNSAGTVTWHRVAGIYGDTVSQPVGTAAANPLRFPGQQFDPLSALHYNYFRDYDPATGRYIETDPIGLAGGPNLYAYVGGNPVNAVDPTGEFLWVVPILVGGGIGAASDVGLQLLLNGGNWECIKWKDVAISAGLGAVGGGLGSLSSKYKYGKEFSHWIPERYIRPMSLSGKSVNPEYKPWLDNAVGRKFINSKMNGNYVEPMTHALTDPHRYLKGMTKADNLHPAVQQTLRVPGWLGGSSAGSAAGAANSAANIDCGCE